MCEVTKKMWSGVVLFGGEGGEIECDHEKLFPPRVSAFDVQPAGMDQQQIL